ncbi:MAG: Rpn family recombination-promoting nuclease/putative transposase [Chloroflexi bacterium]|nr:Rpn family recombination-promoting nuclease/putative transposase [Chloroflexota bacterium]MCI0578251.1 Rpn family recombination-promoting nuclease/putative transposase [Chloroflexota bacterium]MCI0649634.1 Rpn family recombination-promoting nuclease/putative transposase [Chloroflexota bacterium]MCI0730352.1 Rpn family recombination-promoting nuclease/putative transposase [Chloroflexota bacterium]
MSELRNPHDRFFKETFSRPEIVRDFVQNYLPAPVVEILDLDTLELQKDSFVDPELQEHFSDLLYRVQQRNGEAADVYLLLEHKSGPDTWVALQLLRYMIRIWEMRLRQGAKRLTPIIPVVVYHGKSAWPVSQDFTGLFPGPEALRPYWPDFRYELRDLGQYSDDEIRGGLLARATLLLLKYVFQPILPDRLPDILALLGELADEKTALEYLEAALRYLSVAAEQVTAADMVAAVETTFHGRGDRIMPTLAEKWIEEGLEQGVENSVLRVLGGRFGQVPVNVEARLRALPIEKLELALDEAVGAIDLPDFERRLATLEEA